jgi:hypothetical protein
MEIDIWRENKGSHVERERMMMITSLFGQHGLWASSQGCGMSKHTTAGRVCFSRGGCLDIPQ